MVLCHLAGLHGDVSRPALRALLVLLCNRFPKVLLLHKTLCLPFYRQNGAISSQDCICRHRRRSVQIKQLRAAACTVEGGSQV